MKKAIFTILVIDETKPDRDILRYHLNENPFFAAIVEDACDAAKALKMANNGTYDCILLDYDLCESSGTNLLQEFVQNKNLLAAIVAVTSSLCEDVGLKAIHQGAHEFLSKNEFHPSLIGRTILHAIERKQHEMELMKVINEREKLVQKLQKSLDEVKALRGMLPICAKCKKIRDDSGYWHQIDGYLKQHSDLEFTHGCCPHCLNEYMEQTEAIQQV